MHLQELLLLESLIKKLPNELWLQIIDFIIPKVYFRLKNITYTLPIHHLLLFSFEWNSSLQLLNLKFNNQAIESIY
jgi:hypothetical protein